MFFRFTCAASHDISVGADRVLAPTLAFAIRPLSFSSLPLAFAALAKEGGLVLDIAHVCEEGEAALASFAFSFPDMLSNILTLRTGFCICLRHLLLASW